MLFLSALTNWAVETHTWKRADGSLITGYASQPQEEGFYPMVIFIDGSSQKSVYNNHQTIAEYLLEKKIGLISLEKRGITKESIDHKEQMTYHTFSDRLQDYATLLSFLKKDNFEKWNGQLIVMGASEGGKIAPKLTRLFETMLDGTVIIAGGGGLPFKEEMLFQILNLNSKGLFSRKRAFAKKIKEIEKHPGSLQRFTVFAYKWWASYMNYHPLEDLLEIQIPLCMIHGNKDKLVPIASAHLIQSEFTAHSKTNLTYLNYPDLGHSMKKRDDVWKDLLEWVELILQ